MEEKETWILPKNWTKDVDICLVHVMDYIVGEEMEGYLNVENSHYPTFQALKAIREKVLEQYKVK